MIEAYQTDKEIVIHTLEGDMKANVGDFIITGVNGEQYPCKPDIFCKTYEPVRNTEFDRIKGMSVKEMAELYVDLIMQQKCVLGEFVCKKFTYIEAGYDISGDKHLYNTAFIEHRMCIPDIELHEYLYKSRENCGGWAWDISDLVIYDKPKELSEFSSGSSRFEFSDTEDGFPLKWSGMIRPPQSWCYVEEME